MPTDRRDFITAAIAAGIASTGLELSAQRGATMPPARAKAPMDMFGLKYPIFSAGMGGTAIPELAAAVSNAGGLGGLGTGINHSADLVRRRVPQIKAATSRPFAVNYLLAREPVTLQLRPYSGRRSSSSPGAFRPAIPSRWLGKLARRWAFRSAMPRARDVRSISALTI